MKSPNKRWDLSRLHVHVLAAPAEVGVGDQQIILGNLSRRERLRLHPLPTATHEVRDHGNERGETGPEASFRDSWDYRLERPPKGNTHTHTQTAMVSIAEWQKASIARALSGLRQGSNTEKTRRGGLQIFDPLNCGCA